MYKRLYEVSYFKFYQNNQCEYFPCHNIEKSKEKDFNCLFCYCPLYLIEDCGGNYKYLDNGIKNCSNCIIPHYQYDTIINKLTKLIYNNKKRR